MDFSTMLGVLGGALVVFGAIVLTGDPAVFLNLPAFIVVAGGAICTLCTKFSVQHVFSAFKIGSRAFFFSQTPMDQYIEECYELSVIAHKQGPIALQDIEIQDPFLQKGLTCL